MCPARSVCGSRHQPAQLRLTGSSEMLNKLNEWRSGRSQPPAPLPPPSLQDSVRHERCGTAPAAAGAAPSQALSAIQHSGSFRGASARVFRPGLWECGVKAGCPCPGIAFVRLHLLAGIPLLQPAGMGSGVPGRDGLPWETALGPARG